MFYRRVFTPAIADPFYLFAWANEWRVHLFPRCSWSWIWICIGAFRRTGGADCGAWSLISFLPVLLSLQRDAGWPCLTRQVLGPLQREARRAGARWTRIRILRILDDGVASGSHGDHDFCATRRAIDTLPANCTDRKSTRLNSSHITRSRMPSSA